jgi:hypothetical protein
VRGQPELGADLKEHVVRAARRWRAASGHPVPAGDDPESALGGPELIHPQPDEGPVGQVAQTATPDGEPAGLVRPVVVLRWAHDRRQAAQVCLSSDGERQRHQDDEREARRARKGALSVLDSFKMSGTFDFTLSPTLISVGWSFGITRSSRPS